VLVVVVYTFTKTAIYLNFTYDSWSRL